MYIYIYLYAEKEPVVLLFCDIYVSLKFCIKNQERKYDRAQH